MSFAARKEALRRLKGADYLAQYLAETVGPERRGTSRQMFNCPFCGSGTGPHKTPAMSWTARYPDRCHCFSCGRSGDIYDVAEATGVDPDAWAGLDSSDGRFSFSIPRPRAAMRPVPDYSAARKEALGRLPFYQAAIADAEGYLASRGFSVDDARKLGLGYDRVYSSLVMPVPGAEWYQTERNIYQKKFFKPRADEVGPQPTWDDAAWKGKGPVFICEGQIDAYSIDVCGGRAIALMGGSHIDALARTARKAGYRGGVYLMCDNDEAGERFNDRLYDAFDGAYRDVAEDDRPGLVPILWKDAPKGVKDPNDWLVADRAGMARFISWIIRLDESEDAACTS